MVPDLGVRETMQYGNFFFAFGSPMQKLPILAQVILPKGYSDFLSGCYGLFCSALHATMVTNYIPHFCMPGTMNQLSLP